MDSITGQQLYATDGARIGEIVDAVGTHLNDLSPAWLTVKTGWRTKRFVPYRVVSERDGRFVVEHSADTVRAAPKLPVHFEPSGYDVDALCSHYGMHPLDV